jgi:hypothetical protein
VLALLVLPHTWNCNYQHTFVICNTGVHAVAIKRWTFWERSIPFHLQEGTQWLEDVETVLPSNVRVVAHTEGGSWAE